MSIAAGVQQLLIVILILPSTRPPPRPVPSSARSAISLCWWGLARLGIPDFAVVQKVRCSPFREQLKQNLTNFHGLVNNMSSRHKLSRTNENYQTPDSNPVTGSHPGSRAKLLHRRSEERRVG